VFHPHCSLVAYPVTRVQVQLAAGPRVPLTAEPAPAC
jgi:hypothetical protein